MSRARQWVEQYRETRPRFVLPGTEQTYHDGRWHDGTPGWAEVADDGGLHVVRQHMSATVAVQFARWILDTFGDE